MVALLNRRRYSVPDAYNNITIGDIVSELELRRQSLHIYNNTLKGVPTGNTAADGTAEYLITELNGGSVQISTIGQSGDSSPVSQGIGIGIRQHDDVMLSYGYSRTTHIDFQLDAGDFALVVLEIPADIKHHAEGRIVEVYNSPVDVKIIPDWQGVLPAVVSTLAAFNQKGASYDPDVLSIFTFRGTNIAADPIVPTAQQIIDHVIIRAETGQGNTASTKEAFSSVTGRYYFEGFHVALFEDIGAETADISYHYNWHEFE